MAHSLSYITSPAPPPLLPSLRPSCSYTLHGRAVYRLDIFYPLARHHSRLALNTTETHRLRLHCIILISRKGASSSFSSFPASCSSPTVGRNSKLNAHSHPQRLLPPRSPSPASISSITRKKLQRLRSTQRQRQPSKQAGDPTQRSAISTHACVVFGAHHACSGTIASDLARLSVRSHQGCVSRIRTSRRLRRPAAAQSYSAV